MRKLSVLLAEVRRAGIPKAAATYIVAGWLAVQAADVLAPRIGLGERAIQALLALLIACFPLALIAASFRAFRTGKSPVDQRLGAVSGIVALVACFTLAAWVWRQVPPGSASEIQPPLVLMMDSPHPARVYDPETLAKNGTNADVISDILLDLPIRRQKETIGANWHRDEEMRQFSPNLILVHWSGFCQEVCDDERVRLRQFIQYFEDTDTNFLIYSRQPADSLPVRVERMLTSIQNASDIRSRVHTFALDSLKGTPVYWRNPVTANKLKLHVKRLLDLE